jgi:MFS family permease
MRLPDSSRARLRSMLALSWAYFLLFGLMIGGGELLWADVLSAVRLGDAAFGRVLLLGQATAIPLMLLSGPIGDRVGRRRVLMASLLALVIYEGMMAVLGSVPLLVVAVAIGAVGAGVLDATMNAVAGDYEQLTGRVVMHGLHGGYNLGCIAGALGTGAVLSGGLGFRAVFVGLAVAFLAALVATAAAPGFARAEPAAGGPPAAIPEGARGTLAALGGILALSFMAEHAVIVWGGLYLRRALGVPPGFAGMSFALFNATMAAGRLANRRVVRRVGRVPLLVAAGVLVAAGDALLIATTNPLLASAGLMGLGLALAGIVPTCLSLVADAAPAATGAAVSRAMALGYAGFLAGPPLLGWAAERTSVRTALGLIGVLGAGILALATIAGRAGRAGRDLV